MKMMLYVKSPPSFCKIVHRATIFAFISIFSSLSIANEGIAIIDSGLAPEIPRLDRPGWNFFEDIPETPDEINHGTELAREILKVNPQAKFLALKITRKGDGITPTLLAKAIRYAIDKKVEFINLSFGFSKGSEELKSAIALAAKNGIIMVSAAGTGLDNPYEPVDVARIYPQSYKEVFVVGKSDSCESPAEDSNFGAKIDFVIPAGETQKRGSSYTAARALGLLSLIRKKNPKIQRDELKKKWRSFLKPAPRQFQNKMGQGCLDTQKLIEAFR